jgi:Domain of unknown function (DUF397)
MTQWRKSSHSTSQQNSDCVEVADLAGNIGVRDSKNPDGPKLIIDTASWHAFTHRIKTRNLT